MYNIRPEDRRKGGCLLLLLCVLLLLLLLLSLLLLPYYVYIITIIIIITITTIITIITGMLRDTVREFRDTIFAFLRVISRFFEQLLVQDAGRAGVERYVTRHSITYVSDIGCLVTYVLSCFITYVLRTYGFAAISTTYVSDNHKTSMTFQLHMQLFLLSQVNICNVGRSNDCWNTL